MLEKLSSQPAFTCQFLESYAFLMFFFTFRREERFKKTKKKTKNKKNTETIENGAVFDRLGAVFDRLGTVFDRFGAVFDRFGVVFDRFGIVFDRFDVDVRSNYILVTPRLYSSKKMPLIK